MVHSIGNAPQSALGGNFLATPWEDVAKAVQVSTFSLKSLAMAALPLMPDGGSVVGLDFDASVAWPGYDWMGVAKAGLESCARYLARDLGPQRVRVNLVAAGPLKTMAAKSHPRLRQVRGRLVAARAARLGHRQPGGGRAGLRRAAFRLVPRHHRARSCTSTAVCTRSASDRPPGRKAAANGRRTVRAVHLAPAASWSRYSLSWEVLRPRARRRRRRTRVPGGLRASDAERDEVATRLKDEFAAGRLSHDTFLYRMNAVLEARQRAELPPLLADLPSEPPPRPVRPGRAAAAAAGRSVTGWFRGTWSRITGSADADRRDHGAGAADGRARPSPGPATW